MICYLPWNLKDMTNISAEKLQRNISQQVSYMNLYRTELLREAQRFNIASILKYSCVHKNSFGSDALSVKASDCLIVFLHAMALQRGNSFTPSDSENSIQSKGCRNLHRLMLENLKATMKYIDYSLLLSRARGEIDSNTMFSLRETGYSRVFPDINIISVSGDESINNGFMAIIDQEERDSRDFLDFEVRRAASFSDSFCDMFAASPGSVDEFEPSEYGIIGSSIGYLAKPFIRVSGYYFSFVTRYSLENVRTTLADYAPIQDEALEEVLEEDDVQSDDAETEDTAADEAVTEEVVTEDVAEAVAEEIAEDSAAEEIVSEQAAEPAEQIEEQTEEAAVTLCEEAAADFAEEETRSESCEGEKSEEDMKTDEAYRLDFDDDEYAFDDDDLTEPEEEAEESDSFYYETDEYEYPDEFEEDYSNSSEPEALSESSVYEDSDDADEIVIGDNVQPEVTEEQEVQPETAEEPEVQTEEEAPVEEPTENEVLSDAEELPVEEVPAEEENPDEKYVPYSSDSLFSMNEPAEAVESAEPVEPVDEPVAETEQEDTAEPVAESEIEEPIEKSVEESEQKSEPEDVVSEPEEQIETQTDESAHEPEAEPASEPEAEPAPEPAPAPAEPEILPLLDLILKDSPSDENAITKYITSISFKQQKELVRMIEMARKAWLTDKKDKMFTIPDTGISVAIFTSSQDPMVKIQRNENIGAVMFSEGRDAWNSLELNFNEEGTMINASFVHISRNSFSDWEWRIVEKMGRMLIERRKNR